VKVAGRLAVHLRMHKPLGRSVPGCSEFAFFLHAYL
jgi:hypothetical protein